MNDELLRLADVWDALAFRRAEEAAISKMAAQESAEAIVAMFAVATTLRSRAHDKTVKALAPNVGGLDGKCSPQCSGVIAIPTRCVIQITKLEETDAFQPRRST
jgi:hypothetical protein